MNISEEKNYLLELKRELEIIAKRQKVMEDKRNRLFEVAKRPSTAKRLKVMRKIKKL